MDIMKIVVLRMFGHPINNFIRVNVICWNMSEIENILITGVSGFIGYNLAKYYLQKDGDINIIGIDIVKSERVNRLIKIKSESNIFKFHLCDIKNKEKFNETIKGIDVIFHLAGNANVVNGLKNPEVDLNENLIRF